MYFSNITGTLFSTTSGYNTVYLGSVECSITSESSTSIECTVGAHSAEAVSVSVHVDGLGHAASSTTFEYQLSLDSVSPSEGELRQKSYPIS